MTESSMREPDRTGPRQLRNAAGVAIPVDHVIDIPEQLTAERFWPLIEVPDGWAEIVAQGGDAGVSPWNRRLIRRAFFGADLELPAKTRRFHDGLLRMRDTLGARIETGMPAFAIADDIPYAPIVRGWPADHSHSDRYFPRRMHDWILNDLYPSYVLTRDRRFLERMEEMLAFLQYSQYDAEGNNRFTSACYPDEFRVLKESGQSRSWRGGWDFVFDWQWRDAEGYVWQRHEPDHHVCAEVAVAFIRGFETTGRADYLEAAAEFVYHQIPRYGFHTGLWRSRRYYWSEYNPSGPGNPTDDAVVNVQGLVAHACAMVGYYKRDARLLEYARGLLWYIAREFAANGYLYYFGAESGLQMPSTLDYDLVALSPALIAVPYLLKSGASMEEELTALEETLDRHFAEYTGPRARYLGIDAPEYARMHKLARPIEPRQGDGRMWRIATFVQATGHPLDHPLFFDPLPSSFSMMQPLELNMAVMRPSGPSGNEWTPDERCDRTYRLTGGALAAGLRIPFSLERGDVVRIRYDIEWPDSGPSWPLSPSKLIIRSNGQEHAITAVASSPDTLLTETEQSFMTVGARLFFPFLD
jgi:hypothetical protein